MTWIILSANCVGRITIVAVHQKEIEVVLAVTVVFTVHSDVQVPDDSLAKITSASLLGDSYIAIDPGASDLMLEPGEEITFTQGSLSLTDLIVKFGGGTGPTTSE